jgi:hypothetical protein
MTINSRPVEESVRLTSAQVWHALERASFAVVSYVTPEGAPRSSGVVYQTIGRRLYLAVAADGWKARQIKANSQVAVTIPIRRGGILALVLPIPPATISFHARAVVHPAGSVEVSRLAPNLAALLPEERRATSCLIELLPEGAFLTYGLGVTLAAMRHPAVALARVPIG